MSDNNKNIDKEFTDFAWSQMSEMLDKEMPVQEERKRRIIPFFWILGLGVLLGLLGAYGWYHFNTTPHNPAQLNTPIAIEEVIEKTPTETLSKNIQTIDNEILVNNNESELKPSNNTSTDNQLRPIEKEIKLENKTKKSIVPNAKTIVSTTPKVDKVNSTTKVSPSIFNESSQGLTNESNTMPNQNVNLPESSTKIALPETTKDLKNVLDKEEVLASRKDILITTLETKLTELFSQPDFTLPSFGLQIDPVEKTKRLSFGLKAGYDLNFNPTEHGLFGGAFIDVKLSPKWSLQTGINFQLHQIDLCNTNDNILDANSTFTEDDMSFPSNDPSVSNTNVDSTITNEDKTICKYKQTSFSIPVTFAYKLHPKFQMIGGGYAEIRSNKNLDDSKRENLLNSYDLADINNLEFDAGVTAGLRYYPTKNWGVELAFQQGLIPLQRAEGLSGSQSIQKNNNKLQQNLQLSAIYRFGK